jgi:ketosteroid isomerase-like protein
MGLAENKEIARAFYHAANRGDMEACLGQLTSDVTWTNIGSTRFSGRYRGKDDLVTRLLEPLFSQLKAGIVSTIDRMIAEGDVVVVQLRGKSETKDGQAYDNTYCHVFTMRGGKISDVTEYFDTELTSAVFGR